jgi:glycosyltransferase 2 family protein
LNKSDWSNVKLILMGVFLSILFITMIMYVGADKLASATSQASPILLILSTVLIVPSYLIRALRWKLILNHVKSDIRLVHAFWATGIGFMLNFIIPLRIGDLVRAYTLHKKEQIDLGPSISSVMMENTLDLIGQVTFGILGLMIVFLLPTGTSKPPWFLDIFTIIIALLGIIMASIVIGVKREEAVVGVVDRILAKIFLVSQRRGSIIALTKVFIQTARILSQDVKLFIKTILLTYAYWIMQILCIWLVFQAFGYEEAPLVLIFTGAILVWFTFLVPIVPGYVGTFEAFWLLIFVSLGLESPDKLFAMGAVHHLLSLAAIIGMGCSGAVWFGMSFGQFMKISRQYKL